MLANTNGLSPFRLALTRLNLPLLWPETVGLQGVQVRLRNTRLAPRVRRRLLRGAYETAERELLGAFLRPGDAVLEMGAGVGIVSSFIGRQIGPEGRLACVEANAALREDFMRQTALNEVSAQLITGLCYPVWRQPVPEAIKAQSFQLQENHLVGGARADSRGDRRVPWLSGDEMVAEAQFQPTALVVDIEGGEGAWADASPCFPASVRVIVLELHPDLLGPERAGAVLDAAIRERFAVRAVKHSVFALARSG